MGKFLIIGSVWIAASFGACLLLGAMLGSLRRDRRHADDSGNGQKELVLTGKH